MSLDLSRRDFLGAAASLGAGLPSEYPLYRASGSHRQLGREHGEQAASRIRAHIEYMCSTQRLTGAALREKALRFEGLFERHCPHLLDEMRGLAEGAGITHAEALAVNIRGELGHVSDGGCTTYVIGRRGTARRQILVGQNSDMNTENIRLGYMLHLKPEGKPEVMLWTFGGMIGYHGTNSAGIAHFANALGGGPRGRFAMPHYPIKRMLLECTRMDEVLKLFERIPLASSANYVLCDGSGAILDVEITTSGPRMLRDDGAGFLAHTNHFLAPPYNTRENYAKGWQDSQPRLDRMNSLIRTRFGAIAVDDLKAFLSDHSGRPTSICRHDGDSRTVAAIVAEPAARRMHVTAGNPCESRLVTYSM